MGGIEETSDKPQYILRSGAGRNLQTGLVGTEKAFASPVLSHLRQTTKRRRSTEIMWAPSYPFLCSTLTIFEAWNNVKAKEFGDGGCVGS